MRTIVLAPQGAQDIAAILAWSEERFGPLARERYERLLEAAVTDIASDPGRPGTQQRPELAEGARTCHLAFSREHGRAQAGAVRRPRHVLVYRVIGDDRIEIGRVLHDAMELETNLPEWSRHSEEGDPRTHSPNSCQ